jgi:5-methylthioadenosine/S-adenosylhomocysteine deaminase
MDLKFKLIRSRLLLPLNNNQEKKTVLEDGYILTEGSLIKEVGKYSDEIGQRIIRNYQGELQIIGSPEVGNSQETTIPCLDGVVLPGFVKAHGHDQEAPIIGFGKDESLIDWLNNIVFVFADFLGHDEEELSKKLGSSPYLITYLKSRLDDIYYGITSSLNHHCNFHKYHLSELIEANSKAGTKMVIAVGSEDRNLNPGVLDSPQEAINRLNNYWAQFGGTDRIHIIPGPNQVFSNSLEMLKALAKWSREHNTLIHIHSSEEPKMTNWFYRQYHCSPVEYLYRAGFLGENTILAHQVNTTEIDLAILKDTGTKIVHNPLANTILGSGMPPIIRMLEMGIPVAISTDGSGSADNQNILNAARLASQYQKADHKDARLLPAGEVLEMITVVPAGMLRLNAGSLKVGKDADFILIDLSRPNLTPTLADNVVENIIWASDGSEVQWVVAGGRILKDNYRFVTLDEERIKKDLLQLCQRLIDYKKNNSTRMAI